MCDFILCGFRDSFFPKREAKTMSEFSQSRLSPFRQSNDIPTGRKLSRNFYMARVTSPPVQNTAPPAPAVGYGSQIPPGRKLPVGFYATRRTTAFQPEQYIKPVPRRTARTTGRPTTNWYDPR
jgi:hypothetical protein